MKKIIFSVAVSALFLAACGEKTGTVTSDNPTKPTKTQQQADAEKDLMKPSPRMPLP